MNRRGVEFTVMEVEPGLWKWQFQIGVTVTTGKTKSNLRGRVAHIVQQRIDLELRRPRDLSSSDYRVVAANDRHSVLRF
jgi:hypothetical protein